MVLPSRCRTHALQEVLEANKDYLRVISLDNLPITITEATAAVRFFKRKSPLIARAYSQSDIPENANKKPNMVAMPEPGKPLCFFDVEA